MKNLFKLLLAVVLTATAFSSCMKNETDYAGQEEEWRKQEKAIDSLLTAQKIEIEEYIQNNDFFTNPIEDTITIAYSFIDKENAKRGIWYEVISEPTDDSYEYRLTQSGMQLQLIYPTIKLKYTASLLDGTPVQVDDEGTEYNFRTASNKIVNQSWVYAFFPYSIKYNGEDRIVQGLTKNGLKKGSKIRMITPSYWAFGNATNDDIPANSPLVYEFEVLEIE